MSGNVDSKDSKEPDGACSLNAFADHSGRVSFNDLIEFVWMVYLDGSVMIVPG